MALGPVVETGVRIDMAARADGYEATAPVFGETCGFFERYIIVVGTGDDDGWKGQGIERHGRETGGPGRIGWCFRVAGGHEESASDLFLIVCGPIGDGTACQAMTDKNDVFGREGGYDLVNRVNPIFFVRRIPIPLMYPRIPMQLFPAGLPMTGS